MHKNKYLFLIRAYNESSRILDVIEGIFAAGFSEILVVDDGSRDGTADLLKQHFGSRILFLRHPLNR